ncbi:hypothetical protein PR202_gb17432 [Eleusine coracana subsp. coracana]|uniref:Glutaredoxin domain-containing protein n=1 Tax=Eleusine coracana subsp. coracana TaxID=191504 RepID=A0AAV5F325_ELECO|nr:hypothetical protein PR202_gb17432 [Eleusine coracana subsp. coracana]
MGCKGSKHALHEYGGPPPMPRAPEPRRYSGLVGRHSVALRSTTLGTLSLDRAAAAKAAAGVVVPFGAKAGDKEAMMMKAGNDAVKLGPSRSFAGWRPKTPPPPVAVAAKRQRRVAPRTPTKTPARAPEEINVWELMEGLDDDDDHAEEDEDDQVSRGVERKARSAPGSPAFDPEILDAFRKALDELSPAPASSPPPPPPPPDPAVVHCKFTDVKPKKCEEIQTFPGIVRERTYEDCRSVAAVLRGYGVRVDERDLSLHAGFKDELRAALAGAQAAAAKLPQVFADGRHLGGAGGRAPLARVFVVDDEGGAFRRCPECNENGLVRCPVC